MDSLPTITSGQTGWDKVLNEIITIMSGAINGATKDSGWITDGITLINGFTNFSEANRDILRYRYVSMGGVKTALVISGGLKAPANFPLDSWQQLATISSDISQFLIGNPTVQQGLVCFTNNGSIVTVSFNPLTNSMSVRSKSAISENTRLQINYIGIV